MNYFAHDLLCPPQKKIVFIDLFLKFWTSGWQRIARGGSLPTEANTSAQSLDPLGPAWHW